MTNPKQLRDLADRWIAEDHDHLDPATTSPELMDWLIAQLAAWPNRVDDERTTNMRFLMVSAAAALRAQASMIEGDK